ncbi:Phosphatidylinositol-4-phosphate 5-kinase 4 [Hordeum vulgare]|nr:Phosphatidylinositol-4-phosphate 5-kinase 4 [Hordeum vulgare]
MALRVRWEWLRRTDPARTWQGLKIIMDDDVREIFDSLVSISVGDGKKILFWRDRWINGRTAAEIAPSIMDVIPTRTRNCRAVHQVLGDRKWEFDIPDGLTFTMQMHLYMLQQAISFVERDEGRLDVFSWPRDVSGSYTATSTYKRLCSGKTYFQAAFI